MKTWTIAKFIESSNRFNISIAIFMSVCYWLFSQFTGKKPFFSQSVELESFGVNWELKKINLKLGKSKTFLYIEVMDNFGNIPSVVPPDIAKN